jgi:hypothetical protein
MSYRVIRIAINEVEDQALRFEAERACRRPEQQARWLLRQVLGIDGQQMQSFEDAKNGTGHDLAVSGAVLS